jgi:hypothetical protein
MTRDCGLAGNGGLPPILPNMEAFSKSSWLSRDILCPNLIQLTEREPINIYVGFRNMDLPSNLTAR